MDTPSTRVPTIEEAREARERLADALHARLHNLGNNERVFDKTTQLERYEMLVEARWVDLETLLASEAQAQQERDQAQARYREALNGLLEALRSIRAVATEAEAERDQARADLRELLEAVKPFALAYEHRGYSPQAMRVDTPIFEDLARLHEKHNKEKNDD